MNGLTHSYMFKERLLECEPIDLGRFVVDLRERHLDYWASYSDVHPQERNGKRFTYHQWCALRGPWSHICLTSFPDTYFLTFLVTLLAARHSSDLVPTPYKLRQ